MASPEDWGLFLKETCGKPNTGHQVTPEVREFVLYARGLKYSYSQIANAVRKKFGVTFCDEVFRRICVKPGKSCNVG
jgi:hypothetical protein